MASLRKLTFLSSMIVASSFLSSGPQLVTAQDDFSSSASSCDQATTASDCSSTVVGGFSCSWCNEQCVPANSYSVSNFMAPSPSTYTANVFLPTGVNACKKPLDSCNVLLYGPGTAMNSNGYDSLFTDLASLGNIALVVDHEPESLFKLDTTRWTNAVTDVTNNLNDWLNNSTLNPNYQNYCNNKFKFIVGGHSASGGTAATAWLNNPSMASAFFGTDPFDCATIKSTVPFAGPSLNWGFYKTSCLVDVNSAALSCYNSFALPSNHPSILYRVNNTASKYSHCDFSDKGCGIVCSQGTTDQGMTDLHGAVASSYTAFSRSLASNKFVQENFIISNNNITPYILFDNFNQTISIMTV